MLQVYSALSSTDTPLMTRELLPLIEIFSPAVICTPSFSQMTVGFGNPLTGHLIVMLVSDTAVTLSPTFIVTGLPSPMGISRPLSGTSMAGLRGSVRG